MISIIEENWPIQNKIKFAERLLIVDYTSQYKFLLNPLSSFGVIKLWLYQQLGETVSYVVGIWYLYVVVVGYLN
jgi:hypothetical protein